MGKGYQFGTFKGVFTPSILTILGVIMYLRFGWVLGNIGLTLTLAYLLKRSERWSGKRVTLKRIVADEAERAKVEKSLLEFVREKRLDMAVELTVRGPEPVTELIHRSSAGAALVFLGMRAPEPEESVADYAAYYRNLISATNGLPAVLILAAGEVDYRQIVGLR